MRATSLPRVYFCVLATFTALTTPAFTTTHLERTLCPPGTRCPQLLYTQVTQPPRRAHALTTTMADEYVEWVWLITIRATLAHRCCGGVCLLPFFLAANRMTWEGGEVGCNASDGSEGREGESGITAECSGMLGCVAIVWVWRGVAWRLVKG